MAENVSRVGPAGSDDLVSDFSFQARFQDIAKVIRIDGLMAQQVSLIAMLMTPVILAFPRKSILRQALYPLQLYLLTAAFFAPVPPGESQADTYQTGLLLAVTASRIIDRIYMHQPESFLRTGIDDRPGAGPDTYPPIKKGFWALELITAFRGVGWNWEVGGIPKPDYTRRLPFVVGRLAKWLLTFVAIHCVSLVSAAILDAHAITTSRPEAATILTSVLLNHWFLRFFMTVGWLTVVYGHIFLPENLVAVILVSSGMAGRWSDPTQWRPSFGSIQESYTLRRVWGKFWHANLRRSTNAPGEWLLATFPELRRPKSPTVRWLRRYGMLFLAFLVSGIMHSSGSYMVTRNMPSGVSDGGALLYFLAQPTGILIEDLILNGLGIADDGKPTVLRRWVGYLYVGIFWMCVFPHLKVMPLAVAHGLDDGRGEYMAGVRACKDLAEALPFNPAIWVHEMIVKGV